MAELGNRDAQAAQTGGAEVVCFGMITPAVVLAVESLPEQYTGALVKEFISDDAAIVASRRPYCGGKHGRERVHRRVGQ